MERQDMIYDLLQEVRSEVKEIRIEHRREVDTIKKQMNLAKGYIIGLSVISGFIASIIKSVVLK